MSTPSAIFSKIFIEFLHPLNSAVYPQEESQTTSVIAHFFGRLSNSPPIAFPTWFEFAIYSADC
jgi:hypothetical protein